MVAGLWEIAWLIQANNIWRKEMSPATVLTEEGNLERLESVCRRRFGDSPEADECYLYILDKCREDDFRRLRDFAGRSSLRTYLYTLFNNLAADFKRARYGRKRIPQLVIALGAWAEAVYTLVCWQKYSYADAWEIVTLDNLYNQPFNRFLTDIEELHKAPCSENPRFLSTDDDSAEPLADDSKNRNPLEAFFEKLDREKRLRAAKVVRAFSSTLEPSDQLLLKLIYGDNHTIAAAGRLLGLSSMQAQRKLKKLLSTCREMLLKEGITGL